MAAKTKKVARSAKDGRFVTRKAVEECPEVTVMDTVPVGASKLQKLERAIEGLGFRSETDDVWRMWKPAPLPHPSSNIDIHLMKVLTGLPGGEIDFDYFINHAIAVQPDTQRYAELKKILMDVFDPPKAFKMELSPRRYGYYVVGRARNVVGITVTAVET